MKVKNIEIDLTDFDKDKMQIHNYLDIEVLHEYIDDYHYEIIVRRIDNGGKGGWIDNLFVLVNYLSLKKTEKINIGVCGENELSEKRIIIETKEKIENSGEENEYSLFYNLPKIPEPIKICRKDFNDIFKTDIVVLPANLYAVGIYFRKDSDKEKEEKNENIQIYIYNEKFGNYYDMIYSSNLLLRVIYMNMNIQQEKTSYYFIICSDDGYPEYQYMNNKNKTPKYIEESECENIHRFLQNETEYPVFHNKQIILAQSAMKNIPNIIPIIDRHYLYCNLYKTYRSIHRGIPFSQKKNKIIFGCRTDRGSKYNFIKRRDIEINQRKYFYSNFCDKRNMVYEEDGWIAEYDMVEYKYILNIDGNACTWDATAWKLNSGSVIFKVDAPWVQWFYPEYLAYVHYIPIKDDMSDLQEKYQWCETHPEECEKIVENSKKLFQKVYKMSNIIKYIQSIL
jgi:hypothetical protein